MASFTREEGEKDWWHLASIEMEIIFFKEMVSSNLAPQPNYVFHSEKKPTKTLEIPDSRLVFFQKRKASIQGLSLDWGHSIEIYSLQISPAFPVKTNCYPWCYQSWKEKEKKDKHRAPVLLLPGLIILWWTALVCKTSSALMAPFWTGRLCGSYCPLKSTGKSSSKIFSYLVQLGL